MKIKMVSVVHAMQQAYTCSLRNSDKKADNYKVKIATVNQQGSEEASLG